MYSTKVVCKNKNADDYYNMTLILSHAVCFLCMRALQGCSVIFWPVSSSHGQLVTS